jgi:hypothetical protein
MTPHQFDGDGGPLDLPGAMADIFLALVAVVILMLLSLLPAIRTPGGLAQRLTVAADWSNVVIEGTSPAIYIAEAAGIHIAGDDTRVGPDDILQDRSLAEGLRAAARDRSILLVITPQGQESAFLIASLAGSLGIGQFYQLRVDAQCAHVRDTALAPTCSAARAGAPLR